MANTYDVGDLVRVTGTLTDSAGDTLDPTAAYCKVKDPSGHVTTLVYGVDEALARDSSGVYLTDIDVDEAGTWYYRFYSTGIGQGASEAYFFVKSSNF